jgi:hypothetical protein
MLDILVAEVVLQRSRINALICQLEAAGMAQRSSSPEALPA